MVIQGVSYPSDFEAKKQMIEIGRRMDEKAYVIAGEGSLSVRVGPNAVWITAEGAEKGALKQESFIRVDMNGKQSPGSRQTRLPDDLAVHLSVYTQNPALRGILHGYPAGAVAYAALGREVQAADYTPSVRALGKISLIPQGNAEGYAKSAALVCRSDKGILAAGDGCFMWGESLMEAFHKLETLEYYVKVNRLLCGGRNTRDCRETGKLQAAQQSAVPETAAAGMVRAAEMTQPVEIEGLTPLIRPGEGAGFCLPFGSEKPAEGSRLIPAPAAGPAAASAPGSETASAPGPKTASALSPAIGTGFRQAAAPASGQAVSRAEMMAEVVRRSLSSIQ